MALEKIFSSPARSEEKPLSKKESRRLRARGTGSKSLALQNIKNAA
jgi:hypothetical protein